MELLIALIVGIILGKLISDYKYWTRPQTNNITINHTNNTQVNNVQQTKTEIAMLRNELMTLRNERQFAQVSPINSLPVGINEALDVYQQRNIHIPVEIIEAVNYSGLVTPDEVISFIETERKNMVNDLRKRL